MCHSLTGTFGLVFRGRHPLSGSTARLHSRASISKWTLPARLQRWGYYCTLNLTKDINPWFESEGGDRAIKLFFSPLLFYVSWQHIAIWVTSCLKRGFLIRLLGVCHLQPHALFFTHSLSISVLWFSCFPFHVTPGQAEGETAPASFPTHSSSKCLGTAAHCWHSYI